MAINEAMLIDSATALGLIEAERVDELRQTARRERCTLMEMLMRHYRLPESAFYQAVATHHKLPFLQPEQLVVDKEIIAKIPVNTLTRRQVFPAKIGDDYYLAMLDPMDSVSLDSVSRSLDKVLYPAISDPDGLSYAIAALQTNHAKTEEFDSVAVFNHIMKQAHVRRASDIHIEPDKTFTRIRMRVDGHMQTLGMRLTKEDSEALINRVKVLANMDISEQRKPQDGGFSYAVKDWKLPETDIRAASAPIRWGERITLRILGEDNNLLNLDNLGMPDLVLERLKHLLNNPYGMLLVTGPTGSGKSTTLYACLREMDASQINILTVEDPVEQTMHNISQVQVSSKVDFADALRSFLRHDPDVILVGEIRDLETAETAIKSAMTGHLVLSTLHTNSAIGAVSRLANLGCDRYLVGSTLAGVLAQRLVRRLCTACKQPHQLTADEAKLFQVDISDNSIHVFKAKGCPACSNTGYVGRLGLYEMLWIDNELGEQIANGASEQELKLCQDYYSLWQAAAEKVLQGETSLNEVRNLYEKVE